MVEARELGALAILLLTPAGERDQQRRPRGSLSQPPRDLVTVQTRQPDIEQYHVRRKTLRDLERLGAIVRTVGLVAHALQQ